MMRREPRDLMTLSAARERALALAEGARVELGPIMRLNENFFDPNRQSVDMSPSLQSISIQKIRPAQYRPAALAIGASMNVVYKLV